MNLKNALHLLIAAVFMTSAAQISPKAYAEGDAGESVDAPVGFATESYATIDGTPTGIDFTPDGRVLVSTKDGQVRVLRADGTWAPAPALDLGATVCTAFERGLESVIADPQFATNNFIYIYYTWAGTDNSCTDNTRESHRVVRYTLNAANVASAPQIILQNIDSPAGNHNGGNLDFGADGKLYVSVGDGGNTPARSRSLRNLNGKILRINADGGIPADNPFYNEPGAVACGNTAFASGSEQGGICREIFAYGLRNPFKFAFKQNSNTFYINDVGQSNWEEISVGAAGADYGWNVREGFCATGTDDNCGAPPAGMTNPIYAYNHSAGCSINGGAFVNADWPAPYGNAYFFGDWCRQDIYRLVPPAGAGAYTRSVFHIGASGGLLALRYDPKTKALYYTQGSGRVSRLRYTGPSTNRAPVAVATGSPLSGPLPLNVTFGGGASSDPDGDALTYGWTFGDGSPASNAISPTNTYNTKGVFTATLIVTDAKGLASAPVTLRLTPGNLPPTVTLQSALPDAVRVGEVLTLAVNAIDAEDGSLPATAVSWRVSLVHISEANPSSRHMHPFVTRDGVATITMTMPGPEDLDAARFSFIEVVVSAKDSLNLSGAFSDTVQPLRVPLTLRSEPDGLLIRANERVFTATAVITGWHGMSLTLGAPVQRQGELWFRPSGFLSATVPVSATTLGVYAPASAVTYTAQLVEFTPRFVHMPVVRR
jgi:glucose/arabinose dehydrogenase